MIAFTPALRHLQRAQRAAAQPISPGRTPCATAATIAILAGLLLPALGPAKARLKTIACMKNLRQAGMAPKL